MRERNGQRRNEDRTRLYVCTRVVGERRSVVEQSPGAVNTYQCRAEFRRAGFLSAREVHKIKIDSERLPTGNSAEFVVFCSQHLLNNRIISS